MIKKLLNWKTILWTFILSILLIGSTLFYMGDKRNIGERNFTSLLINKLIYNEEPINVIVCWTPLQMSIAEKIIEQHPNEKFHFILFSYVKNNRFDYYFNRLKQKSEHAYSFYFLENNSLSLLEVKLKSLLLPKVKTFFISNIDSEEIHILLDAQPNANIKTFDDGTSFLIRDSYFLSNEKYKGNRLYDKIFHTNTSLKNVRESTLEHFTIFKDFPNIMEIEQKRRQKTGEINQLKISYIKLFNNNIKPSHIIKDTTKILLGTVENELKETSEKIIKEFGIKYTTMHPRQTYRLDNAITLESNLIIEDYLLKEIEKNPNTQYEIYTFFSGAALTMKDFPNVKVFAIKPSSFPDDYWLNPVYELFEKANIPILEFDDKK